jgi:hypothetical protein
VHVQQLFQSFEVLGIAREEWQAGTERTRGVAIAAIGVVLRFA